MPDLSAIAGRRLGVLANGRPDFKMRPGDYCGPVEHPDYHGDLRVVYFRKPHAGNTDAPAMATVVQHVTSATHRIVDHEDGTVSITPEIPDVFVDPGTGFAGPPDGWTGTLRHGQWHQAAPPAA